MYISTKQLVRPVVLKKMPFRDGVTQLANKTCGHSSEIIKIQVQLLVHSSYNGVLRTEPTTLFYGKLAILNSQTTCTCLKSRHGERPHYILLYPWLLYREWAVSIHVLQGKYVHASCTKACLHVKFQVHVHVKHIYHVDPITSKLYMLAYKQILFSQGNFRQLSSNFSGQGQHLPKMQHGIHLFLPQSCISCHLIRAL